MNRNPEFFRQLLLECSQPRLIAIPLLLWAVFALSSSVDGELTGRATAHMALLLFMGVCLIWGGRQARDSLADEFADLTWDTQRLSALGPWQLVWGKLLGSTLISWYAGLICLTVYAVAVTDSTNLPEALFFCIATALTIQSASLLMTQLAVRRGVHTNGWYIILALAGIGYLTSRLNDLETQLPLQPFFLPKAGGMLWYGMETTDFEFQGISLISVLFWCTAGNYRLMSEALDLRSLPWFWLVFCGFLSVYFGGFAVDAAFGYLFVSFLIFVVLTYFGITLERNDAMRLKRLTSFLQRHSLRRFAEEAPVWWLSFLLATVFAVALSLSEHPAIKLISAYLHFYPLPILLLLLRDCALYLYFCYSRNPQRALSLTLLNGAMLYAVLPWLLTAAGLSWLASLAFPLRADSAGAASFYALLQDVVLLRLLFHRWQASI